MTYTHSITVSLPYPEAVERSRVAQTGRRGRRREPRRPRSLSAEPGRAGQDGEPGQEPAGVRCGRLLVSGALSFAGIAVGPANRLG